MLNDVIMRVKITGYVFLFFVGVMSAIFAFPITYWVFGISPDKVADWTSDKIDKLKGDRVIDRFRGR